MTAEEKLARLQALCEAIAHPARRQILLTIHLRGGEITAGDIARRFEHAWPTTTRHINVLVEAGLLLQRAAGRERWYRIAPSAFAPLEEWLNWFAVANIHSVRPATEPSRADTVSPRAGVVDEPAFASRAVPDARVAPKKRRSRRA